MFEASKDSSMLPLIVILAIALPIAWITSECQNQRWIRLTTGIAAIAVSFLVAIGVGALEHLNANAWYGSASKNLIDTTIEELEHGDQARLLKELKSLQKEFQPTYENRARYDKLIEGFLSRLGRKRKHAV